MWAERMKLRLFVFGVVATIVLLWLGVGELGRCLRTLFGAPRVTMAEVAGSGLQKYGYVRITGVRPVMDRTTVVVKKNKTSGAERWTGAYVPLLDAASKEDGQCSLLAWLPDARSEDDLEPLAAIEDAAEGDDPASNAGGEIVGFVKYNYDGMDPYEQQQVAGLAHVNVRNCWVVDVSPPSWLRGGGCVFGALIIPAGFALWKMKHPV